MNLLCRVCVAAFLAVICVATTFGAPPRLAVIHVAILDSAGKSFQSDQAVLIEKGRITFVGPSARLKPSKDAQIIDAHGKFLIPGLWDMHVHIAGLNADPSWSKQVLLPLLLANGITGVRDMGGDLDALLAWKREIESGTLLGPHIVASGPFLVASENKTPEQIPIANAGEARAAVRDLKQRGADFIKIISLPSREAFFAVADEAKKQNIPFVGHLPFQINAGEASNAGMHSIEHLLYSAFALSFSSKEDDLRQRLIAAEQKGDSVAWEQIAHEADATYSSDKATAVLQTLKKNGTYVTPTLASLDITSHPEEWTADDPQLAFVPTAMATQWRESLDDGQMRERAAWLARQAANDWKLTGELHRAGIPLLVGSDSLDPFIFPGESLHEELVEFVRAGFMPAEALEAATRGAARFLSREADFGAVESGKAADLVLLDASPLEEIRNTRKIAAVIRGGTYLDRGAIDKMLAQAKAAAGAVPAK